MDKTGFQDSSAYGHMHRSMCADTHIKMAIGMYKHEDTATRIWPCRICPQKKI